jgi:hypothetical protein
MKYVLLPSPTPIALWGRGRRRVHRWSYRGSRSLGVRDDDKQIGNLPTSNRFREYSMTLTSQRL